MAAVAFNVSFPTPSVIIKEEDDPPDNTAVDGIIRLLAPILNLPDDKVSVFPTVFDVFKITPFELLMLILDVVDVNATGKSPVHDCVEVPFILIVNEPVPPEFFIIPAPVEDVDVLLFTILPLTLIVDVPALAALLPY